MLEKATFFVLEARYTNWL